MRSLSKVGGLAVIALTLLGSAWSVGSAAAAYPERPITMIVPWGAGGGTDATGRILATLMEKELGVPVSVVNRTGGSGVIGHSAIATAAPDGYTLGVVTVEIGMMHWQGLTELTYQDYTPLALYNADAAGLQVRTDSIGRRQRTCSTRSKPSPAPTRHPAPARAASGIWRWPACCRRPASRPTPRRGCRARARRPACRTWSRAASTSSPARCPRRRRCSRPAGSRASP